MKICVVGNCQAGGLVACLKAMLPDAEIYGMWPPGAPELARGSDLVFVQTEFAELVDRPGYWQEVSPSSFRMIPSFAYSGFHPDCIYAKYGVRNVQSPLGDYNSALVLYGWLNDLSVTETLRLFCDAVYDRLNYHDYPQASDAFLIETGERCGVDVGALLREWRRQGCFTYTINHPKLYVLSGIMRAAVAGCGLHPAVKRPEDYLQDDLVNSAVWPVYPDLAARLGIDGSLGFKVPSDLCPPGRQIEVLDLEQFVVGSFASYAQLPKSEISVERFDNQRDLYRGLEALAATPRRRRSTPYSDLPDYCFWQRSVGNAAAAELDPVVNPKFQIGRQDRIATAGSCFAQHIAKTLIRADYNYFVAEPAPAGMPPEEAGARGYGLFSARFGNVYSARQLRQLLQRAYGEFRPADTAWRRDDGRFVDPFRPQVEPDGYDDAAAVEAARDAHFAAVREMFERSDLFVFTVGLTEAWAARSDGAVFPVAPGVIGPSLNNGDYRFVNFTVSEVIADLDAFIAGLRAVNPDVRLLFTVSPVPLVATYENRHVLVATTYSKSALRAAVDEVVRRYDFADYFPSYEVITGWYNKGRYFDSDLRSVTQEGVDHVMRLFRAHYLPAEHPAAATAAHGRSALQNEIAKVAKIICDEELLARELPAAPPLAADTPRGAAPIPAPPPPRLAQSAAVETRLAGLEEQIVALRVRLDRGEAEQRQVRDTVDAITDGVRTWLMPTIEKHAAAIGRAERPLRAIGRQAARLGSLIRRPSSGAVRWQRTPERR